MRLPYGDRLRRSLSSANSSPIDKFLGGNHDFHTLDGMTSLTVNMNAFLINAAWP